MKLAGECDAKAKCRATGNSHRCRQPTVNFRAMASNANRPRITLPVILARRRTQPFATVRPSGSANGTTNITPRLLG